MDELVATPCSTESFFLGEGCRYDEVTSELLWVSIYDGALYRARCRGPEVEVVARHALGGEVSAVAPLAERADGWLVAKDRAVWRLGPDGALERLATLSDDPAVRTNDGAADPDGRFWVGTMAYDAAPGAGRLYRYDAGSGVDVALDAVTISNGLAWPDPRRLYYADSATGRVDVIDLDDGSLPAGRRPLVEFAPGEGQPDGLCLDAEGALWVALWGGGAVARVSPEGEVLARVALPVSQPTSCAIGGAARTTLYVTTAREDLTDAQLAAEPLAGRLFCCDVGVAGAPIAPAR